MENGLIADRLKLYSQLLDLHNKDSFRAKTYANASFRIDKMETKLATVPEDMLEQVDGIGKSLCSKITAIIKTGSFDDLNTLLSGTPAGVIEMLGVKGIGPKKVAVIWKELGIESPGELLYACNENRLVEIKGFGLKTQQAIIQSIQFQMTHASFYHYATLEGPANELLSTFLKLPFVNEGSLTGDIRRKCEVLENIEVLVSTGEPEQFISLQTKLPELQIENADAEAGTWSGRTAAQLPFTLFVCKPAEFAYRLYETTGNAAHLEQMGIEKAEYTNEIEIYNRAGLDFVEPEMREGLGETVMAGNHKLPELIKFSDIKGTLHNHSTYSDGLNTLEQMARHCKERGFEYLGICDHSRTAVYAHGLEIERVLKQHEEIDKLNRELAPFKIFKGIESDILGDGSLDYPEEILKKFDFLVASVHSNLKMSEEKATARLLKAIENPYTTILGHPTGRLLLMRPGYPINHRLIIDACARQQVVIEINANPYRLDMDWRWINYALEKGVKLSINPDAHELEGFDDMYYGVCVARKGGLSRGMTLNALSAAELEDFFIRRKESVLQAQ
jgi:DNA polymerase (family 10)